MVDGETEPVPRRKSVWVAFLLLALAGPYGAHRFYLGVRRA